MTLAQRQARIRELRQYGTTEDAESTALELLAALPDDPLKIGIFASFDDVDDDQSGNGGIHFQSVSDDTVAIVGISASGTFEDCHAVKDDDYIEYAPETATEAAEFLINRWLT
jgi:hypothetical protein